MRVTQESFNYGEGSPLVEGRTSIDRFKSMVKQAENFIPYPQGPIAFAPGTRFLAKAKYHDRPSIDVPFQFSETQSYRLEFGDQYIRFYRNQGQIVNAYAAWTTATAYALGDLVTESGNYYRCIIAHTSGTFATDLGNSKWEVTQGATDLAYEIPSPYGFVPWVTSTQYAVGTLVFRTAVRYKCLIAHISGTFTTDLGNGKWEVADIEDDLYDLLLGLKFTSSADVTYIWHSAFATRKLIRVADDTWTLQTVNWKPTAMREQIVVPNVTLTLGALTGSSVIFTASGATFLPNDVGRMITSGPGRASITAYTSSTVVTCEIIDAFLTGTAPTPLAALAWYLLYTPRAEISVSAKGKVGEIVTVTAPSTSAETAYNLNTSGAAWEESLAYPGSFYIRVGTDEYLASCPQRVQVSAAYPALADPYVYPTIFSELNYHNMVKADADQIGKCQWGWGDVDTLGYDTIYVRLYDESNPDDPMYPPNILRAAYATADSVFRSEDVGKYIEAFGGLMRITAYTADNSVNCEVITELDLIDEDDSDTFDTEDWTLNSAVWTYLNGYPSCGAFHEDRLYMAGSVMYPQTIWASMVSDYENMSPGVDASDAIEFTLSEREVNKILWLHPKAGKLMVGTVGGEWKLQSLDDGAITPTTPKASFETAYGSEPIAPITVGDVTLFVQRFGLAIREFSYQWDQDNFKAEDLCALAEHITDSGIKGLCYQRVPFPIVWCWRTDGQLIGCTFVKSGNEYVAVGWFRYIIDGTVESVCVISGEDGDEVHLSTVRDIGGTTYHYKELMEPLWLRQTARNQAKFCQCGLAYSGVTTCVLYGLDHLEGETVNIIADGRTHASQTVTDGKVILTVDPTTAFVGLPMTGVLETFAPEFNTDSGSTHGKMKRIKRLWIKFYKSISAKVGRTESDLYSVVFGDEGTGQALSNDTKEVAFDGDYNVKPTLFVVQSDPQPCVIESIAAEMEVK